MRLLAGCCNAGRRPAPFTCPQNAASRRHDSVSRRHKTLSRRRVLVSRRHKTLPRRRVLVSRRHKTLPRRRVLVSQRHKTLSRRHVLISQRHKTLSRRHVSVARIACGWLPSSSPRLFHGGRIQLPSRSAGGSRGAANRAAWPGLGDWGTKRSKTIPQPQTSSFQSTSLPIYSALISVQMRS